VLEELFRDKASGGEDSESESLSEMSHDSKQMSDATRHGVALSSENPDDSRRSCRVWRSADFWATVCKTVCSMLSDRCLYCLSVTLVYCGQMVGLQAE